MPTLEIKSLYDESVYADFLSRLNTLTPDSTPKWGKMNVAQMLAHCAEIQEVMNGKPLDNMPWYMKMMGGFIKKFVINNKPYKHNLGTAPQYIVADKRDFETEMARFKAALEDFQSKRENPPKHPLFGDMTEIERGWGMYKHHEHHLKQFGV